MEAGKKQPKHKVANELTQTKDGAQGNTEAKGVLNKQGAEVTIWQRLELKLGEYILNTDDNETQVR